MWGASATSGSVSTPLSGWLTVWTVQTDKPGRLHHLETLELTVNHKKRWSQDWKQSDISYQPPSNAELSDSHILSVWATYLQRYHLGQDYWCMIPHLQHCHWHCRAFNLLYSQCFCLLLILKGPLHMASNKSNLLSQIEQSLGHNLDSWKLFWAPKWHNRKSICPIIRRSRIRIPTVPQLSRQGVKTANLTVLSSWGAGITVSPLSIRATQAYHGHLWAHIYTEQDR